MPRTAQGHSAVRISLLDVMYGVVLAYGFSFFDSAETTGDYLRFFFAYAVFVVDWIYVHSIYWGWEYRYNAFLILDIGVLFTISRLLSRATGGSPVFWMWMSILFGLYFVWDALSVRKRLPTAYDWRFSLLGDLGASLLFGAYYALVSGNLLRQTTGLQILMVAVYTAGVLSWFRRRRSGGREEAAPAPAEEAAQREV